VTVHGYLLHNRFRHRCGMDVLLVRWDPPPLVLPRKHVLNFSYGRTTQTASGSGTPDDGGGLPVPNMELGDVLRHTGIPSFNVALIDCEGCIPSARERESDFVAAGSPSPGRCRNSRWIRGFCPNARIYEERPNAAQPVRRCVVSLPARDFRCVWYIHDVNVHSLFHSVWVRRDLKQELPGSCHDFLARHAALIATHLLCSECPASAR